MTPRRRRLPLTRTEFRLLAELAGAAGQGAAAGSSCWTQVWGYGYFGDSRIVDVHIRRLRTEDRARPGQPEATSSPPAAWATDW